MAIPPQSGLLFRLLAAFFVAVGLVGGVSALERKKPVSYFALDTWRDELPQGAVLSLIQTHDGYMWIGTFEGLVRFDGVRFDIYDKRNTPAIRSNNIKALWEDRSGALWIGTLGGGVVRYVNGEFTAFTTKDGLANDFGQSIAETPDGAIWVATNAGLSRYLEGKWTNLSVKDGLCHNSGYRLSVAPDGALWYGSSGGGVSRYKDGKFTNYTAKNGLPSDTVFSLYAARNGDVWVGSNGYGLARLRNGAFTTFKKENGLPDNVIHEVIEDHDGVIWLGLETGGMCRFVEGDISVRTPAEGLAHRFVRAMYFDREGSLWVGTNGGLNRLRDAKFSNLSTIHGLKDNNIRVLLEDRKGRFWIGLDDHGLDCMENGKIVAHFSKENGFKGDSVRALAEDPDGSIWVGINNGGIAKITDGRVVQTITSEEGLKNQNIYALLIARDGRLWIGTVGGGVLVFDKGKPVAEYAGQQSGQTGSNVRILIEDKAGVIWAGTNGRGLLRIENGAMTAYSMKEGLSSNQVFGLYEDADGVMWIGTGGGGLCRLKDGKITVYDSRSGMFDDTVFAILEDPNGYFWMTCNRGIFRVPKKQLTDIANGNVQPLACDVFGKSDGMGANQCNGTSWPAAMKSRDGQLWFPTVNGVAVIDPSHVLMNTQPPPVVIDRILADGKAFHFLPRLDIAPGATKLEFHYAGLSYLAPEKVKFRYKLEGVDTVWVDADTRRAAYYTNLSPGTYRFSVQACNNDGVWNETGATVEIDLKPFLYQTIWAKGFLILLAGVVVVTGVRLRFRALAKRAAMLEATVAKRTEQLNGKNAELEKALDQIKSSQQQVEIRNRELAKKNEALVELHKRADLIFSALQDVLPGTIIEGKYRLDEKIGAGGFGAVYRATHLSLRRPVAVKVFRPAGKNASTASVERFRLEGISACRINHPNAVSVLDSGVSSEGIAYIVMELLNGLSLATDLKLRGPLPPERCVQVLLPICDVLAAAHAAGIVHRDIKPDNIFLHQTEEGEVVKVVDFGIAKLIDDEDLSEDIVQATETGGIVGTPIYMAPERLNHRPYDGRSDVYSLGIVFYQMLTGKVPFPMTSEGIMSVVIGHLRIPPPSLKTALPNLPDAINAAIEKALAKNSSERPTAREFGDILAEAIGVEPYRASTGMTSRSLVLPQHIFEEMPTMAGTMNPEDFETAAQMTITDDDTVSITDEETGKTTG